MGAWGKIEEIASQDSQAWSLDIGLDNHGKAAIVWDNAYAAQMSRRTATDPLAPWTAPELLTSNLGNVYAYGGPFMAFSPTLAADAQGDVLVSWLEEDATTGLWTIEAKLFKANNGTVENASWPVDPQIGNVYPSVTLSQNGSIGVVAWNDNGAGTAYAASFSPATGWAQPLALGNILWSTQIALGSAPNANASAIWLTNTAKEFFYRYVGASNL